MLAARDVEVARGGATLLQGVTASVGAGEAVALIGPNGAGKSTLLHALSGATATDAGTVCLDATPVGRWPPAALARRRAVLPQAPALDFPLTVGEVVRLGRSPHAGTAEAAHDAEVVAAALGECEIEHLAERPYPRLSGGERQRVQLARVLAQVWTEPGDGRKKANHLLLDEPTNNLDIAHQLRIAATAKRFADEGNGVLAVLHDPNLAAQYADRIVVLRSGRVLADGPPEAIVTADVMEAAFGVAVISRTHPVTGRPYMLPAQSQGGGMAAHAHVAS